jgi:hypothetical protein
LAQAPDVGRWQIPTFSNGPYAPASATTKLIKNHLLESSLKTFLKEATQGKYINFLV